MHGDTHTEREARLATALQLNKMSGEEQQVVLEEMLGLALEAALGRLLLSLSESEQAVLELYVDTHRDDENMLDHLFKSYPAFSDLLEEELQALEQEAVAVTS